MKIQWFVLGVAVSLVAQTAFAEEAGLALARKSGCLACHSVEHKVVGPAWRDVAARYRDDDGARARLIAKVKKGGKGNWTDVTGGVPMPPYSPRVADADIETLVDFVLSLK
jgi:cytochrome c